MRLQNNSFIKKGLWFFFAASSAISLQAQQLPQFSQYYINPFVYNPAKAGSEETVNTWVLHRSQFADIPGAPVTNAFTIDGPVKDKNFGLGLSLFNDATDIVSRLGGAASYSYKLKLNDESDLRFGLALSVFQNRIDFSKAVVKDINDPFLMKQVQKKTAVNGDFGVLYTYQKLEAGVSVAQLAGNQLEFFSTDNRTIYNLSRHYIGTAKYTFDVKKDKGLTAYPFIMVRYAEGVPFNFDVNAVLDWKERGWFGVSYKSDYAIGFNLGVRLNNTLSAGYCYDLITGPLKSYSGMSHEIMLGYKFGKKEAPAPEIPQVAPQTDTKITDLETVVAGQKTEIEKLKADVEKLKQRSDSVSMAGSPAPGDKSVVTSKNIKKFITTALASEYADEGGQKIAAGHYLVIGSFMNKANAERAAKNYKDKGYGDTKMMVNKITGINYVFIKSNVESADALLEDLNKVRQGESPDSWIYHLEE